MRPQVFRRKTSKGKQARSYSFRYLDPDTGKNRWVSTKTGDKRVAERFRDDFIDYAEAVARGDINPQAEQLIEQAKMPIGDHVGDYLRWCRISDCQDLKSVNEKQRHLRWFLDIAEPLEWRLDGIRADVVDERLGTLTQDGRSARTVNLKIESMRAFLRWCVSRGRLGLDPLRVIRKRNETVDRRHVHRVLTYAETDALESVAKAFDGARAPRKQLWYCLALHMGLRLGDLKRIRWGDFTSDWRTLEIRGGKAKHRVDYLPVPERMQLLLQSMKPRTALPSAPVFPTVLSNATRRKDYERAGIEHETSEGIADLHCLRATYGTRKGLQGVAPAVLQKLMRHSTPALTSKYYIHLQVDDLRAAQEPGALPRPGSLASEGPDAGAACTGS